MLFSQVNMTPKAAIYGGHWEKDINIYIDYQGHNDILGAFGVAINSWNEQLKNVGAKISISQAVYKSEANVIVTVTDSLGMAAGITDNYPSKYASIYTGARIRINLEKNQYHTTSEKVYIATHELGHVLGLEDIKNRDIRSVMYYVVRDDTPFPTNYDTTELGKIY